MSENIRNVPTTAHTLVCSQTQSQPVGIHVHTLSDLMDIDEGAVVTPPNLAESVSEDLEFIENVNVACSYGVVCPNQLHQAAVGETIRACQTVDELESYLTLLRSQGLIKAE